MFLLKSNIQQVKFGKMRGKNDVSIVGPLLRWYTEMVRRRMFPPIYRGFTTLPVCPSNKNRPTEISTVSSLFDFCFLAKTPIILPQVFVPLTKTWENNPMCHIRTSYLRKTNSQRQQMLVNSTMEGLILIGLFGWYLLAAATKPPGVSHGLKILIETNQY